MAADILLVGLGETGASIGLALAKSGGDFQRTGYDPHREKARAAHKAGAVDRLTSDPRREAGRSDLVIYSLAASALGPELQDIAGDLKADSLLIDTSRLKQSVLETVPARLKPGSAFIGAVPILGPGRVFHAGAIEPSADLFSGGTMALVLPPGTSASAADVCMDLAVLLGATPFFLEAAELDAATAATETLPVIVAAAYLRSLASGPSWRDRGRLAERTFESLSRLAADRPAADTAEDLATNRAHVVRWIDSLLTELETIREVIGRADAQGLSQRFEEAATAYQNWRTARERGLDDVAPVAPEVSSGGSFARLLGLRRPRPAGR